MRTQRVDDSMRTAAKTEVIVQKTAMTMPRLCNTILVVDDEPSVRKVLRRCFESESYNVLEADCGEAMFTALRDYPVDLITLDLNLAGDDGLQLAREVRTQSLIPIIMVSGKNDLIDKVVGLEVGADDYISKPFELREVLARVRSVLRRAIVNNRFDKTTATLSTELPSTEQSVSATLSRPLRYRFNGLVLCTRTRELRSTDGRQYELTTAEFDLLEVFARHAQQALTRDQIMNQMKGHDWYPNDRTIDNHVAQLRKKLTAAGSALSIKTIRGVGYQFTAEVAVECMS